MRVESQANWDFDGPHLSAMDEELSSVMKFFGIKEQECR